MKIFILLYDRLYFCQIALRKKPEIFMTFGG